MQQGLHNKTYIIKSERNNKPPGFNLCARQSRFVILTMEATRTKRKRGMQIIYTQKCKKI